MKIILSVILRMVGPIYSPHWRLCCQKVTSSGLFLMSPRLWEAEGDKHPEGLGDKPKVRKDT